MSTTPRHLGKYELQQKLGQGGVGEVWKAYDLQLRRDVAVKILHTDLQSDPNFINHFTKEGQSIASLHHSHIVQIHDVNVSRPAQPNETSAYIVMEYVEGHTLADYIHTTSQQGNFPSPESIVYLFTSLGEAIDYAYQRGIIHGNIKPSNILLNERDRSQFEAGEPMLTDFGLHQLLGKADVVGAPHYMSPEQAKGLAPTHKSDIYALGVLLYELCTGLPPFRDESSVAVIMEHINTLPTPPALINPNIPSALSEVILRALAKEPLERFPTASALATAIAKAYTEPSSTAGTAPMDDMTQQASSRMSMPILGVSQMLPDMDTPPTHLSKRLPSSNPYLAGTSQAIPTSTPYPSHISQPLPSTSGRFAAAQGSGIHYGGNDQGQPWIEMQREDALIPHALSSSPNYSSSMPLSTRNLPIVAPSQTMESISTLPRIPSQKRSNDVPFSMVVAVLLLLLLVIVSAIGASLLLNRPQATADTVPGRVFFQDDAFGHDDQIRLQAHNVATPPDGKSYFAWLKTLDNKTLPLGQVNINDGGSINFLYPGDGNHTNLLSIAQGFIITQENSGSHPTAPTGTAIYQGMFDTAVFQQVRAILTNTPDLPGNQSVIVGMINTISSMNDKAGSIVDTLQGNRDYPLVKRQAGRIVEMIEGTAYARDNGDLGRLATQLNVQAGLISTPGQMGYIDILEKHLNALKQAANNNDTTLLRHIQNVQNAITDLKDWIQKCQMYAIEIIKSFNLADPAILNDALQLKQLASDAYTGRTIPPSQSPQPTAGSAGANQAYVETQYMANIDLQKTSS